MGDSEFGGIASFAELRDIEIVSFLAFITELLNNIELLLEKNFAFRSVALPFGRNLFFRNHVVVDYVLSYAIPKLCTYAR